MSGQNGTVVNTNPADETAESESELEKQPFSSTENEQAFRGPKFSPPVYRRRYAAVCELAKEHQARKVMSKFGKKKLISEDQLGERKSVLGLRTTDYGVRTGYKINASSLRIKNDQRWRRDCMTSQRNFFCVLGQDYCFMLVCNLLPLIHSSQL